MIVGAWLHDLDPFVWRISGDFGVRWYGVAYLLGFFVAYLLLRFLAVRGATQIPRERAADAVIAAALGAVIGGRIGYVALYQPSLLWDFSSSLPFWGVLAINKGGMASHGGMVGVWVAAWIVSRGFKTDGGTRVGQTTTLHVIDRFALLTPPGLFFGRMANFINGELLGKQAAGPGEAAPWWSVRFPQEVLEHPDEVGAAQWKMLEAMLGTPATNEKGVLTDLFVTRYEGLVRDVQAGSAQAARQLEPLLSARHPSQIYQAVAEGLVLALVLWIAARKPRRTGTALGVFMVVYGVGRIITEFWRLPDAHLAVARFGGLSRGQWLSVLLAAGGIGVIGWVSRAKTAIVPGWGRAARENGRGG